MTLYWDGGKETLDISRGSVTLSPSSAVNLQPRGKRAILDVSEQYSHPSVHILFSRDQRIIFQIPFIVPSFRQLRDKRALSAHYDVLLKPKFISQCGWLVD